MRNQEKELSPIPLEEMQQKQQTLRPQTRTQVQYEGSNIAHLSEVKHQPCAPTSQPAYTVLTLTPTQISGENLLTPLPRIPSTRGFGI